MALIWSWKGWSWTQSGIVFNETLTTLMSTLAEFSFDRRKRETVKKELIQLGVHPSAHVAEVSSSPRTACFVHIWSGLAFDLRTGWDLNDSAQRAKMWSHLQHERRTQCWDVTHEVDDGHFPLASCSRTFLCTPIFWKVVSECRVLCNEIDFGASCRRLEDVHHEWCRDTQTTSPS